MTLQELAAYRECLEKLRGMRDGIEATATGAIQPQAAVACAVFVVACLNAFSDPENN